MNNNFKIIIILLIFLIVPFMVVNARSGCCSHHGGVCGCKCCDGTSLSSTCAPYYPQCNSSKKTTNVKAVTKSESTPSASTPKNTSDLSASILHNVDSNSKNDDTEYSFFWIILGAIGVIFYIFYKKTKK